MKKLFLVFQCDDPDYKNSHTYNVTFTRIKDEWKMFDSFYGRYCRIATYYKITNKKYLIHEMKRSGYSLIKKDWRQLKDE